MIPLQTQAPLWWRILHPSVVDIIGFFALMGFFALIGMYVVDFFLGTSLVYRLKSKERAVRHDLRRHHEYAHVAAYSGVAAVLFAMGNNALSLWGLIFLYLAAAQLVITPAKDWALDEAMSRAVEDGYALPFVSGGRLRDLIPGLSSIKARNLSWLESFGECLSLSKTGSVLVLGTTRSGKTEVGKTLAFQMNAKRDEPVVVYDHKTDYQEFFEETLPRDRKIVRVSAENSTHNWNLFEEIEDERDCEEIARAIFPKGNDDSNEFFGNASRQLFAAVLRYLHRERDASELSNRTLVRFFERVDREDMHKLLSEHDDLVASASALDPEAGKQSAGVFASLQQRINDVFVGDFADDGGFSIREYMENPDGRILILDYPQRQGETVVPIFRFLIDRAGMFAMDDGDRWGYFVLDEFARVPGLRRIGELVNVGAGQKVQLLLTLQSVNQLYDNYSKERGTSILSGLRTQVILRLADDDSIEHARTTIGSEFNEYTHRDRATGMSRVKEMKREEEHIFAKGEFTKFQPGEAVVVRPGNWAYGYAPMLSDGYDVQIASVQGGLVASNRGVTGHKTTPTELESSDNEESDPVMPEVST